MPFGLPVATVTYYEIASYDEWRLLLAVAQGNFFRACSMRFVRTKNVCRNAVRWLRLRSAFQNNRSFVPSYRRLSTESLESRTMLNADVAFRLEVTDLAGIEITTANVGNDFLLNAYVQDLRPGPEPAPEGVFSAYMDVEYDSNLVTPDIATIVYGPDYQDRPRGEINPEGTLDEVGAARITNQVLDGTERLLFTIEFTADAPGVLDFSSNFADIPANEVLLYNHGELIDDEVIPIILMEGDIEFGSTSITILGDGVATLGNRVWRDLNLDGLQGIGEPGVASVQVEIFSTGGDGAIGGTDDVLVDTTTTDVDGMYQFDDLAPGQYYLQFSNLPAGTQFTQQDAGDDAEDSDVDPNTGLTNVFTLVADEINDSLDAGLIEVATPSDARFDISVVLDPTPTDSNGQTGALPESRQWLHEWQQHWVEIWISTPDAADQGVTSATATLQYDTDIFTATSVEPSAAFDGAFNSTIDDTAGAVELSGDVTTSTTVGADQFVLLALVRLEPTSEDTGLKIDLNEPTPVASTTSTIQVRDDGSAAAQVDSVAIDIQIAAPPSIDLYPLLYDLDDDGRIGFGDLSILASVFLQNTTESSTAVKADFDLNDRVDFGRSQPAGGELLKIASRGQRDPIAVGLPRRISNHTRDVRGFATAFEYPRRTGRRNGQLSRRYFLDPQ